MMLEIVGKFPTILAETTVRYWCGTPAVRVVVHVCHLTAHMAQLGFPIVMRVTREVGEHLATGLAQHLYVVEDGWMNGLSVSLQSLWRREHFLAKEACPSQSGVDIVVCVKGGGAVFDSFGGRGQV